MARFSNKSAARLKSLSAELGTISTGGPPFFDTVLPQLRELLGLDATMFYDLQSAEKGLKLDRLACDQLTVSNQQVVNAFDALLSASAGRWGLFEPTRPEPQQRNLSHVHPPFALSSTKAAAPAWLDGYGLSNEEKTNYVTAGQGRMSLLYRRMDVYGLWQLRVLVCEQDSLLAWVGGFSDEEPGDDARRLLNSLVPALRRRLVLERVLARGPLFEAALQASLEHVPRAAYVLSDAGGVLLANSAGIAELDRSPVQLRAALAATQSPGDPSGFSVTPIHAYGRAPIHLVVAAPRGGIEDRVAPFARKLGLTPRQKQVLAALAIGEANKTIAARLQCAERTIELHISAILEKAGVDSRAALIARFFLG